MDGPWESVCRAVEDRRAELHDELRDAVESKVADFRFADPAADERAHRLREDIIDAEIATLRTGDVPTLGFMVDLGRQMGAARLPLEHHFTAHRAAYPLLLDAALHAARGWPSDHAAELVRRHNRYATATTEAYLLGYLEARDADVVDNPVAARRFFTEITTPHRGWSPNAARQAATLGIDEDTLCCAVLGTWTSLGNLAPDTFGRRTSAWLSMVPAPNLLLTDGHLDGLVVAEAGTGRILDTLAAAVESFRADGVCGLRLGISSCLPAGRGPELAREAALAHEATDEHRPVLDATNLSVLDYLVAVRGANASHLVPEGVRRLHALVDRTDPSCRRVLEVWHELDGDLRAVAAHLHCHPNTVLNRLRTVTETTGFDPRTPRGIVALLVGLATLDQVATGPPA